MPHPAGGEFLLKRGTRHSLGPRDQYRMMEGGRLATLCPPVFLVPLSVFQLLIPHCWEVRTACVRVRQVSEWQRGWLADLPCLLWQTSLDWQSPLQSCGGISSRSTSSILNNATLLEAGVGGSSGTKVGWGGVGTCHLGAAWYNLVSYCSAAPRGFKYLPWMQDNERDRKSMFWHRSTLGRFKT